MSEKSAHFIFGGEMEIVKITPDLYDEAVQIFAENFVTQENICIATQVTKSQEDIDALRQLAQDLLQDGISFAARHCASGQLASICINHIMCATPQNSTVADIVGQFKSPRMICIMECLNRMETTVDLYKEWQIDCVIEIVFLATRPQFTKRGLASILSEYSINYSRQMFEGKLPVEEPPLPAHVRDLKPKAVCSIFTSLFTQRIGRKFNFQTITTIPYTEFEFEGTKFSDRLDPMHTCITFEAVKF